MSSVSGSSGQHDFLSSIVSLSEVEQGKHIEKASANEVIDLFESTINHSGSCEQDKMQTIRGLALKKVIALSCGESLSGDQIKNVEAICKKNLPQMQKIGDNSAERGLIYLLISKIDANNIGEMIRYALEQKSRVILNSCMEFITNELNIEPKCDDFGLITFRFEPPNTNSELIKFNALLSSIKKNIEADRIVVEIASPDLRSNLKYEDLLSFLNEHSDVVQTLWIDKLLGEDINEKLNALLKNCTNLKTLKISNCDSDVDFERLADLLRSTKIENLSLVNLFLVNDAPDFSSLKNLKRLEFTWCSSTSPPILTGLSQLEALDLTDANIDDPPDLTGLTKLNSIILNNCLSLKSLPDVSQLANLEKLEFKQCSAIDRESKKQTFDALLHVNCKLACERIYDFGIIDTRHLEPMLSELDFEFYANNLEKFKPPNYEFRMALFNELVKNDPQKAIENEFKFSEGRVLPILDKHTFSNAVENYCLQQEPDKALRLAIDMNDIPLAEKAVQAGADVNKAMLGSTPMLRACKFGSAEMVEFLLLKDADPKFVGGTHEHETPLSEARLRADLLARCIPQLTIKDAGFTEEVMELKLLSHKFSVKMTHKVDGKEFYGEGYRPRYIVENYVKKNTFFYDELKRELLEGSGKILDSFGEETQSRLKLLLQDPLNREKFVKAIETTFSTIEHSIDHEGVDINADGGKLKAEFLRDLNDGKPVVCFSVTNTMSTWKTGGAGLHAWGLVVTKDPVSNMYLVHQCNRGHGTIKSGILVGKFNEESMLKIVAKYQQLSNWKIASKDDAAHFFDELGMKFVGDYKHIKQTPQKIGNCCYYSLQSIELALLKGLLTPLLGEDDGIALAREIKRVRTSQMRLRDLESYLESHFPESNQYSVDWSLLSSIYEKAKAKPKLHRYQALILDYTLRVIALGDQTLIDNIPESLREDAGPSQ